MKKIITYLLDKKNLSVELAKSLLIDMGLFNNTQITALINIYNMRNPSLNEIEGFRQSILYLFLQINLNLFNAIDIVGTGGDKNTFNISTIASFVVAGAGEKVIKHGNYANSSIIGSSNILEMLGCKFTTDVNYLKQLLEKSGVCFLHTPLYNPSIRKLISIRKNIKIKTILNILSPLINPSENHYHLFGVNSLAIAKEYFYILQKKNKKNYFIIHSLEGYDEISLTCPFKCYTVEGEYNFSPQTLGCLLLQPKDIKGGQNFEENKNIFLKIISGNGTSFQNEVVIVNAAFALTLINKKDWWYNYTRAKESLESGKAKESLKKFLDN